MTDIAPIDQNAVKGLIALDDTTSAPIAVQAKTTTGALYVHLDSSDVSIAGGTEYSDGDVNADPTGTVAMGTDGSNIFALHTDTSGDLQVDILNASLAVTGTFYQATQPVSLATVPSHAVTNAGTFVVQAASTVADGSNVTLGAKADAKSTATDTTAITIMQVLKQISASVQAPPTQAVTFTGSTDVATQTTLAAINTKLASGTVIGD